MKHISVRHIEDNQDEPAFATYFKMRMVEDLLAGKDILLIPLGRI